MWTDSEIYKSDLLQIVSDTNIPWQTFEGKNVLITGATGLIGSSIVNALLFYGSRTPLPPSVYALVRDEQKAHRLFGQQESECAEHLKYVVGDLNGDVAFPCKFDYIIHCASQTASAAFVSNPVETLTTAIAGTTRILEAAKKDSVSGMVYLSSMEVYGHPAKGQIVTENDVSEFNPGEVRNCYPISKLTCESLCSSYAKEYALPVSVIRLTQTFGPGVVKNDKRVFAEFMRCAVEGEDIVLKTTGETERCYLYTADAVRAILTVLLKGAPGEAYTAANPETYCSIRQMAQLVLNTIGTGSGKVRFDIQDTKKLGYADTLYMNLDTSKITSLGWKPQVGLAEMYWRMAQA